MEKEKFSLRKRASSFKYAFDGIIHFFSTQHNAIIHAVATIAAVALSIYLPISSMQVLFVIVAIGLVWMAELFNTAIEQLCDMVCAEQHPQIKLIKDLAAAAVLVTAIVALATACIIFIPAII